MNINPHAVISDPSALYQQITQQEFRPAPNYEGATLGSVPSTEFPDRQVSIIKGACGVNIQRFPSPTGYRNNKPFFIGSFMFSFKGGGQPYANKFAKLATPEAPSTIYTITEAEDLGLLPGLMSCKCGVTGNFLHRRHNHESVSSKPTKCLAKIQLSGKYSRYDLETAMHEVLSKWLAHGREWFALYPIVVSDIMHIQTEKQLLNWIETMRRPVVQQAIETIHQFVFEGNVHQEVETRAVEVVQSTV